MKAFTEPLEGLNGFSELSGAVSQEKGLVTFTGCTDAQKAHLFSVAGNRKKKKIIVTFQEKRARQLYEDYRFYDPDVAYYPAKDILFYQSDIQGNALTAERVGALKNLHEKEHFTWITTFDALMNTMIPPDHLWNSILWLHPSETLDLDKTVAELVRMGYEKEYQVEHPGQLAVRGGILDLYPLTEENPVRIELWGDEIDTIRSFDSESQRSIENLQGLMIYPAVEVLLSEKELEDGYRVIQKEADVISAAFRKEMKTEEAYRISSMVEKRMEEWKELRAGTGRDAFLSYFCKERICLLDYFPKRDTMICFEESARTLEHGKQTEREFSESMKQRLEKGYILPGQMKELFSYKEICTKLEGFLCAAFNTLESRTGGFTSIGQFGLNGKSVNSYNGSFELLVKDLKQYRKNGYRLILLSGSRTRARRLSEDLLDFDLPAFYTEDYDHSLLPGEIMVCYGKVHKGFEYPDLQFAVISESDIFGSEKKVRKRYKTYEGEKIHTFAELSVGDYVVHENHGLGIYQGMEKLIVDQIEKDYLKIEYEGGSNLYILATQLDRIQKYSGKESAKPKLNRLGGMEWAKATGKARQAVKDIAQELVQLYASRENQKGYSYQADTVWQKEFEELFPYEETEGQELAIEATKRDMESTKIMDRLICGDVGYGKTEIAIRAAFKAAQESKQVAYLVPTTILAQQVYNVFSQRMKDYPVRIDLLCRFRSSARQKKTIEELKRGSVDIVVGTHRLLSKDVAFKDLGLLIVDEEQRFGVTHKERIKQLKTNVDVLTLTATPIPRTLHMSLIGIRDMSVLEEPPMDRMPIQTFVMEYNEEFVREAIARELSRDGQVYYVYNRVRDIDEIAGRIANLVPEASVAFAHGQMKENQLERIMYSFINGEIDVLVSTTIIETGLDISNVNTIIVHDADTMGLSQLYQLRGRVGRSSRAAYAFLMYKRDKILQEVAEKRLAAIREYTDLGSGFKIAMRDLEIRGAGTLLGASQSGHMEAVGYDLYCKMLSQAVKEAKGEEPAVSFPTTIDIRVNAFIPSAYIANEYQKLDIYKRIADLISREESEEMLDELIDRFGDPPDSVKNLLAIALLKARAHAVYITEIAQKDDFIKISMYEKADIRAEAIPQLVSDFSPFLRFRAEGRNPAFFYDLKADSRERRRDILAIMEDVITGFEQNLK